MALTLTSRPLTNYIAVKNQCLYRFKREDFAATTINPGSPNVTVTIVGDVTASITAGQLVTAISTDLTIQRSGTVISSTFSAGNTTVTFANSGASVGALGGYLNNLSRTQYRVQVEVYEQGTNRLIGTFDFSPDKLGQVKADVSAIIRSQIAPDITATTVTPYTWFTDNVVESFYIKYREVWTSSSNSQTDDVANIRNAVYAANQIGQSNNQLTYPSILGAIYAAWKAPFNFLTYLNNNTANLYLRLTENNLSFYLPIDQYTGLRSMAWEGFVNSFVTQTATAAIDWTAINKSQWQVVLGVGQTSEDAGQLVRANNVSFDLTYTITMTATGTFTLSFLVYSESNVLLTTINISITAAAGTQTGKTTINVAGIVKRIDSRISSVATAGQTITLRTSIDFTNQLSAALITTTVSPTTDTVTNTLNNVKVIDTCNNQFNVVWRNRFGGLSNYIFQANQDFFWRFNERKIKQFVLYAEQLIDEQVDQLEDLNTIGDIYNPAYDELPNNFSQKKIGTQVYKCESNGVLTGIVVNPTSNKYKTYAVKSRTNITVEMPDTIL